MQRDMDLIRTILMRIEGSPSEGALPPFGLVWFAPEQVGYHVHIMAEDGLIEAADITSSANNGPAAKRLALTAKGHVVGPWPWMAQVQAVQDDADGKLTAVFDPRDEGGAAAQ